MLALINPEVLPALRTAGTFFLLINILAFIYIFRNRHGFFGQDPNVTDDIPAVRKLRVEDFKTEIEAQRFASKANEELHNRNMGGLQDLAVPKSAR